MFSVILQVTHHALKSQAEILKTPNRGVVEPQMAYAMSFINNIERCLNSVEISVKMDVLGSIFSGKMEFDGKNFRTDNLNSVLALIYQQTNELRGLNKKSEESFSTFPASVPYDVLFSNEFLRDLSRLWSLRDIAPDPNNL